MLDSSGFSCGFILLKSFFFFKCSVNSQAKKQLLFFMRIVNIESRYVNYEGRDLSL